MNSRPDEADEPEMAAASPAQILGNHAQEARMTVVYTNSLKRSYWNRLSGCLSHFFTFVRFTYIRMLCIGCRFPILCMSLLSSIMSSCFPNYMLPMIPIFTLCVMFHVCVCNYSFSDTYHKHFPNLEELAST